MSKTYITFRVGPAADRSRVVAVVDDDGVAEAALKALFAKLTGDPAVDNEGRVPRKTGEAATCKE